MSDRPGKENMTDLSAPGLAIPAASAPGAIRVGDVFSRSWKMFGAHWIAYPAVVLLAYAPLLAIGAAGGLMAAAGQRPTGLIVGAAIAAGLLAFACLILAHAVIYVGVWREFGGGRFSFGQAIGAALRQSPAFIALTLIVWFLAMLAALLLIFPAVIVLCVYSVAFPACIVERLGPLKSMSRSAFLTRGNRWRIFGLMVLLYLGTGILSQLLIGLAQNIAGAIFSLVVLLPVEGVVGAFVAVTIAVLYADLRIAREGVDIDHIARVFD
jgi:uncharacterized membrane protein